jgi:hypothetical protein
MIGQKTNKWTVIRQVAGLRRGKHFECYCECGYVKIIPHYALKMGKTKQCQLCQRQAVVKIGDSFGAWQIIEELIERTSWGARRYKCQCVCGIISIVGVGDLRSGKSKQCISCHISKKNTSHGLSKTPTYRIWAGIIGRCLNINNVDYRLYGGRNIKFYLPWQKFENFLKDMGERPRGMEIDRIDPDGDYEPKNCRWVTHQENVANRRMSSQNRDKYVLACLAKLCSDCLCKL